MLYVFSSCFANNYTYFGIHSTGCQVGVQRLFVRGVTVEAAFVSGRVPVPEGGILVSPSFCGEDVSSALVADALGEGPGALPRDIDKPGISRDLVEHGKDPLWFGEEAAVEVRLELQQGVVDPQAVVFYAPRNQVHMLLLPRQPLKNLQKLSRCRI